MFKKFLEMFGDLEDEVMEEETPKQVSQPKMHNNDSSNNEDNRKIVSIFGNQKREDVGKMKVSYVSIIRPKTFEDSRLISDSIKERKVVTFSLEFLGFETGQRVIDFVSGTAYAMDAHLSKITDKVFTSIPSGIGYEDVDTTMEDASGKKSLL